MEKPDHPKILTSTEYRHNGKQHGGSISVESTVGKGSTFTVRLPLNHPHTSDDNR